MTHARLTLCLAAAVFSCSLLFPAVGLGAGSGVIAGVVEDASSHAPLAEIEVCAYNVSAFGAPSLCKATDSEGKYSIGEAAAGAYKVEFAPTFASDANYVSQYYSGRSSWSAADLVTLGEGETRSAINAAMQPGGEISGTVVDSAGKAGLENIQVCARAPTGPGALECAETDAAGKYTISGLETGSYPVKFSPGYGETSPGQFKQLNYVSQYYDGKASEAAAEPVDVVAGTEVPGIDAEMEVGAQVSGTVVAAVGKAPLEGVEACPYQGGKGFPVSSCDYTNAAGEYTISGLPSGSYKVGFAPNGFEPKYASQYFDGKATLASADLIPATAGATASGIDAELVELGKISGKVKAAGDAVLAGISVCATSFPTSRCASTDSSGEYTLAGLTAGSYRVHFSGGTAYVSEYYENAAKESAATLVGVSLAATTPGVDAELVKAGKIEGKVIDSASLLPLQEISVCPREASGFGLPLSSGCASTDAAGKYAIGGLASGSYRVSFGPSLFGASQNYIAQYYDGKSAAGEGSLVSVASGVATTGIDAAMHPAGRITGTVTAADTSLPVGDTQVCAIRAAGREPSKCAFTDATGEYTIFGLATDAYKVQFWAFESSGYLRQYYDDKPTRKLAEAVSVTAGSITSGIDATLHPGATITGTVTGADTEAAIKGVEVCALRPDTEFPVQVGCGETGADGEYAIEGVPSGSYPIRFSPPYYRHLNYLSQYYDGKPAQEGSDQVTVSAGSTLAGIDAEMEAGGRITGKVIDAVSEDPAPSVAACAINAGGEFEQCGYTDSSGEYAIVGLPTGSYGVHFAPGQETGMALEPPNYAYAAQYYDGKASKDEAASVGVVAGVTTPSIDAEMAEGGKISGAVTDAGTAAPMRYVQVCVHTLDLDFVSCAMTGQGGEYLVEGLAGGDYYVDFRAFGEELGESANYLAQYFSGGLLPAEADPVTVVAGATTPDVDVELHPGGQIEGRVTAAAGGSPLQSVEVCAFEAGSDESAACTETDVSGEYRLPGLPTHSYSVRFSVRYFDEDEGVSVEEFATQYYSGKATAALSSPVSVTVGAITGSIDAKMVRSGEEAGGGGEGSGSPLPLPGPGPSPPSTPPPPASRASSDGPKKPSRCRKGFKRKRVHGKVRCVKVKRHR